MDAYSLATRYDEVDEKNGRAGEGLRWDPLRLAGFSHRRTSLY